MLKSLTKLATQLAGKTVKKPVDEPVLAKVESVDKLPDGRPYLVTRKEILMGRDAEYPLTPEMELNLAKLLEKVNIIRYAYGKPLTVNSGYRPGKYNEAAKGAKNSAHLTCEAVDFSDPLGELDDWCMKNKELLKKTGLRMEATTYTNSGKTRGWTHLDTRYKGGDPIFIP